MTHLHLNARRAVAALALILGFTFITDWPAAQEGAQGKPKPDAVAAAGRGAPGPKNVIEGKDEDDRLLGTDGEDWVFGRKGQDIINGGKGRDVIDAGEGEDTVDGGEDSDIIDGGAGSDMLRGGDGDDTIEGSDDDDVIDGGNGADDADGGDGSDVLRGAGGDDVLAGGDGDDTLQGGAGNDRLSGNDGIDSIAGGPGNDIIAGGDQGDSVIGEAGDDTIDGGQGDDTLKGGAGNDTVTGSAGGDLLDGGNDHDTLAGGDGRDVVNGGGGSDLILGGNGTDFINGGDGDDILFVRAGDVARGETEFLDGGAGEDVLMLNGFASRDVKNELPDPLTSGIYRLANLERVQHTKVVPHLGLDPARSTSLLLVNPSATEASAGRLLFYGADGKPLAPRANALKGGEFSVPALGAVAIETFAPEGAIVVSAQLFSNVPLAVTAQTASAALGTFAATEAALLDGAVVPIHDDQNGGTGVVITNSLLRSRVKLTVRDAAGAELECCSTTVELLPYTQRTIWVRELFPRLGNFQGALTIDIGSDRPQEGGPVAVVALQRRGTAVSATPAVRVTPAPSSGPLLFGSMTAGGDAATSLILVNPSYSVRARGMVAFADQQGRPWSVAINKQPAAATLPFDLAPLATLVLTTTTGGPVQTGVAQVEVKEGSIGGVVRSVTAASIVEVVPATQAASFVSPVMRDRAAGVTTELAITSSGPAATVQVALHDQAGALIAGSAAQLRVPANGQLVRTFDELFPNLKQPTAQATMVAASDQRVAVKVDRIAAGTRASLPVSPTR